MDSKKKEYPNIPGLLIIEDFITEPEHDMLLNEINKAEWENTLKRRVQQYGYQYNYTSKKSEKYLGELLHF